jgi:excisionase family DNA binding protein
MEELLQVDRITVYRMVKDGRLKGVKVGKQWRFRSQDIAALISGDIAIAEPVSMQAREALPIHCVQVIQDVFADILQIGAVTTDVDGEPITEISNSCAFCNLILSNPAGRAGCVASWKRLAQGSQDEPEFAQCHAGLQYARGKVKVGNELMSILVAGQFYISAPSELDRTAHVSKLAAQYGLDAGELAQAAATVRTLDVRNQENIGHWLKRVAATFEQIARERADLLNRLQTIAAVSSFDQNL